jgi:hypothetical protein
VKRPRSVIPLLKDQDKGKNEPGPEIFNRNRAALGQGHACLFRSLNTDGIHPNSQLLLQGYTEFGTSIATR